MRPRSPTAKIIILFQTCNLINAFNKSVKVMLKVRLDLELSSKNVIFAVGEQGRRASESADNKQQKSVSSKRTIRFNKQYTYYDNYMYIILCWLLVALFPLSILANGRIVLTT